MCLFKFDGKCTNKNKKAGVFTLAFLFLFLFYFQIRNLTLEVTSLFQWEHQGTDIADAWQSLDFTVKAKS